MINKGALKQAFNAFGICLVLFTIIGTMAGSGVGGFAIGFIIGVFGFIATYFANK